MDNPNNMITIIGRLENGLELTHKYRGHAFHEGVMLVKRASGAIDRLPVSVPAKLLTGNELNLGEPIRIEGQLRSYKLVVDGAGRLQMKVFAQRIRNAEKATENDTLNCVQLTGTIIGQTTYRHTPFGRAICDQLIIVDREFGKYDRIPMISWGMVAKYAAAFAAGTKVRITGRLQSRDYEKMLENGEVIQRTVCEVSAFTFEAIRETEHKTVV